MNEIRDIIVGIDFGRRESQLCYYDRKEEEPVSVSMKVGRSQYEFPTILCRRMEQQDWCFGIEAEYFAREQDGLLVDNLYEICQQSDVVRVGDEEKQPWELMGIFLQEMLKTLGVGDLKTHMKAISITVDKLTEKLVSNLARALESVGFTKEQYFLQDYSESFFFYTLSQKPEYWSRSIGWFDFQQDRIAYRKLYMNSGTKPVLAKITDPVGKDISGDPEMRDMEFYQFINESLGNELFASLYITGKDFDPAWAQKSVPLLCKQKRKVFSGNNLFAKGACYTAKEKLENHKLKDYLYAGDALVRLNVGMDMVVHGTSAYYPIVEAGCNWYECNRTFEVLLNDKEDLCFTVTPMDGGVKRILRMPLPGLPKRPARATRLRVSFHFSSVSNCTIQVEDLGLGDLYPGTHKIWEEALGKEGANE